MLTVLGRTAIPFAQKGEKRWLNLRGTNLAGAELYEANLQWAVLTRANLTGAKLGGANLQVADISDANLQGADLQGQKGYNEGAKGLTTKQVDWAYWDETTKWPEGFTPPAPERLPPKEEKQEKE